MHGSRSNELFTMHENGTGGFFTKGWIAYLLLIRKIWMIQLFTNREQIRLLNSKSTDLDWYCSKTFLETEIAYSWLTIRPLWTPPPPWHHRRQFLNQCEDLYFWFPFPFPCSVNTPWWKRNCNTFDIQLKHAPNKLFV